MSKEEKTCIIFSDKMGIGIELAKKLKSDGINVIEVEIDDKFVKKNDNFYTITGKENDYEHLLSDININQLIQIIHLFTLNYRPQIDNLEELDKIQELGVYGLFYLSKILQSKKIKQEIDIVLIADYVNEVSGNEELIKPENSLMFGLGKVLRKENPFLKSRCIDADSKIKISDILHELNTFSDDYIVAYRDGIRYIEEFSNLDVDSAEDTEFYLKQQGIYIITGGLGGIGLEIAKYMASLKNINIAFINRINMSERKYWEKIIADNKDKKMCSRIKSINAIESLGTKVITFSSDVSDYKKMEQIINQLVRDYGKINGIIHGAGISQDEVLENKTKLSFKSVLSPKVTGTWILDILTKDMNLDFFIMFSSVATFFSSFGQGDYVAANSYLDSFASKLKLQNKRALTINWATWKDVGMAAEHKFTIDTIFKTLSTEKGIDGFKLVTKKNINKVLIGELNTDVIGVNLFEKSKVRSSGAVKNVMKKVNRQKNISNKTNLSEKDNYTSEVTLTGRDNGNYSNIEKFIANTCKKVLGFNELNINDNFFELGADSIILMQIFQIIDNKYPQILTVVDLFQYSSISKLSQHIMDLDNSLQKLDSIQINNDEKNISDDIAIIGLSFQFPKSDNLQEYWSKIVNLEDCSGRFPSIRQYDTDKILKCRNIPLDSIEYAPGAYLEKIDCFDSQYFGITPKEANLTDPNQRLFYQTALKAIEDAGYGGNKIINTNTGVYLGFANTAIYSWLINDLEPDSASMSIVGNTAAVSTGRISYFLDLKGPSMVIDTACSSSLVAIHTACKSLKNGDCDMAIAAGVRLSLVPIGKKGEVTGIGMSSSDGRTKTFDDSSDGTGTGEGVAAVILKPLKNALEDNDHIYALIKGSATNQDGNSAGITAPNPVAQEDVIIKAWQDSGVNPESISYIEAHGTGTQLGDLIEISGINRAFKHYTDKKQFCAVSSVKTNIGHLSEAAGIAGFIKAIYALQKKVLPPQTLFERPNRKIDFTNSAVYVNTKPRKWNDTEYPRRCGVSGFGMSGTNCHIILEQAPDVVVDEVLNNEFNIFTLSAKTNEGIIQLIEDYKTFLEKNPKYNVRDICYTASTGRGHYECRMAIIVNSYEDFKEKIEKLNVIKVCEVNEPWFFYDEHKLSEINNITFNESTNQNIKKFIESERQEIEALKSICCEYIAGNKVDWESFYQNINTKKISLPTYPFLSNNHWLNIPDIEESSEALYTGIQYYAPCWLEDDTQLDYIQNEHDIILIFKDEKKIAEKIIEKYKSQGKKIIEVSMSDRYSKLSDFKYTISEYAEDYKELFKDIKNKKVSQIIHMLSVTENTDISDFHQLEKSQKRGLYSLFYMIKAIVQYDIGKLDIILIAPYVNYITAKEERLHPEYAPLHCLGKVILLENSNINCRAIDIDDFTNEEMIMQEIQSKYPYYLVAYRNGKRYLEEIRDIEVAYASNCITDIKENGIYIITGGTGGIGIAVAKYLASKNKVKIIMTGRTKLPDKEQWNHMTNTKENEKIMKIIQEYKDIEMKGSEVFYYRADVSKYDEMSIIFKEIKDKFKQINGIIHSAGIAGEGFIFRKEEDTFSNVVYPKIYGAWILDKLTENDNLDFFIMFSSAASIFSEPGQGDYASANSYLDAFSYYRNKMNKKTLTIDWVAWKETGMAVRFGVNTDGMFKALTTNRAINALDEALNKNIQRVMVGELNQDSEMVCQLDGIPLRLSYKLRNSIQRAKICFGKDKKQDQQRNNIELVGNDDSEYSEIDNKLAYIYSSVLGFNKIDIYDNFFELGGDSILLVQLHSMIENEFPGKVSFIELYEYSSIAKLSEYISNNLNEENELPEDEDKKLELELDSLIDQIKESTISIEHAIENLDEMEVE